MKLRTFLISCLISCALTITVPLDAKPTLDVVPLIEGTDPYIAVPNAKLVAGNERQWHAIFEAKRGAEKMVELVPAINMAGSELATLHEHGVRRRNVDFVIILHTTAADVAVLKNEAYRAQFGVDNPNLPVLQRLRDAGVHVYVCGQQLTADNVPLGNVDPSVDIAEDGLIAVMMFEGQGYAHLTF
jgi:intracellular sulfur oxidation DsrE/DsrF family protein